MIPIPFFSVSYIVIVYVRMDVCIGWTALRMDGAWDTRSPGWMKLRMGGAEDRMEPGMPGGAKVRWKR